MAEYSYIHVRTGAAKYRDLACLLGHPGPTDDFEPPTFVMIFDETAAPPQVWGGEDLGHVLIDVVAHRAPGWDRPQFVALAEDGAVVRMLPGGDAVEDIPGAGLWKPGARKFGYATAIRSLDARLHVIGLSGQCWRERPDGGWEEWDEGLLEPGPQPIDPADIARSPEGDTYLCDSRHGRLWVRGAEGPWRELANPARRGLLALAADPQRGVWVAGQAGTLIHGTAAEGFRALDTGCAETFEHIAWHEGTLWLASPAGLWRLMPGGRVAEVATGLTPPLRSTGRLQAVEGALWCFGTDDLARLEAGRWTRFACPVGPPFR